MKSILPYLAIVILIFTCFSCNNPHVLFQENQEDWFSEGDATWSYYNNELVGSIESGSGFVMTRDIYKDFVLELEFNPDSTINSGVFIRCKNHEINPSDCYEINIWDLHPNQDYRTGSVVMKSNPLQWVETINKWNTLKIVSEKNHIKAWINGNLTADIQDSTLIEGHIGLQAAVFGEIKFRDISIEKMN